MHIFSISSCLNASIFPKDRLNRIYELMKETLNLLENGTSQKCENVSTIITKNNGKQIVAKSVSRINEHPLYHAVIIAISDIANIHLKAKSVNSDLAPDLIENYKSDYLCTNYECFLSQEPCLMCAMALVHSRIKRVYFYSEPNRIESNECNDQPFTLHYLHINANLNHRYEVWKLMPTSIDNNKQDLDEKDDKAIFPNKKSKS